MFELLVKMITFIFVAAMYLGAIVCGVLMFAGVIKLAHWAISVMCGC